VSNQILTDADWEGLSVGSQHKINMLSKEKEVVRPQLNAQDAYLNNIRIALNNFVNHDAKLGLSGQDTQA